VKLARMSIVLAGLAASAAVVPAHAHTARNQLNGALFIDERVATFDDATGQFTYYLLKENFSVAGTGNADGSGLERLDYSATGSFAGSGGSGGVDVDYTDDGRVDADDLAAFEACASGPAIPQTDPACADKKLDADTDVDQTDFGLFQRCWSGTEPAAPGCTGTGGGPGGGLPASGTFVLHGRPVDVLPDGHTLLFVRARFYDLQNGRWLQRDPTGFADGPDLYEAYRGNAQRFTDPFGLDSIEEDGRDFVYRTGIFIWTYAKGISDSYVLIDHPEWPYAFIMTRSAAKSEFDRPWYASDFTHPYEIMQHATTLVTRSGTTGQFLAVLDKRSASWLTPDEILTGDAQLEFNELAQGGLRRLVGEAASLTRMSYSAVTGALAAPAGAGAAAVDVAATALDLTKGSASSAQVVVLTATVGGTLLHLRFADDVLPGAGGVLEPRIRVGPGGRIESAFAKIELQHLLTGTRTTAEARTLARQAGGAADDAGHLIGRALGGRGGATSGNIIPQAPRINRGEFRQFETMIAQRVAAGDQVYIRIVPRYRGGDLRPYEILYQARINGKTVSQAFPNP